MNEPTDSLLELAHGIDPGRASVLRRDFGSAEGSALAVLLGTAFPPLTPSVGWQLEAVERILHEGWRLVRTRADLLERLRARTAGIAEPERVHAALRRAVWGEKVRIALRELLPPALGGASLRATAHELADLADAAFEVALAEADAFVAQQFGEPLCSDGTRSALIVFGLGKLGGLELNAGSDVDVVFVYDTDDGGSRIALHDHWTRVARRLVATFETPSEDGIVWRVDLRLRPEGSQGPIVNSFAASERYYETWGRLWERAALLRARPIAGDRELGWLLEREVFTPFVYRREVEPQIATALAELVQRSRVELSPDAERDLKLGPGGIREAEFFVQSLQLIWGGREPSVRVQGTLPALERLRSRGLVSDREASTIAEAYVLLRRVEHRVQWMTGIQTHCLPRDPDELARIAKSLELEKAEELEQAIDAARARVAALFGALAPQAPRPPPRHQRLLAGLDTGSTADDLAALAERELGDADVAEHLRALARRPDSVLGALSRERFPALGDQLVDAILESSDPEQAARYLRAFFARFVAPGAYVQALAEDPRALRRLVTVLGASVFVAEAIVGRPDLADVSVFGSGQVRDPLRAIDIELDTAERTLGPDADEWETRDAFVSALRRAKGRTLVEVAVADLAGTISTREATRTLSDLADAIVDRTLAFEMTSALGLGQERSRQRWLERTRGLAVIAVGKLGGRDIGYGSDLDVLFVYDASAAPASRDAGEWFVRRAQRIIGAISESHPAGAGYELDTRLRPSGSHGLLVTSYESFARYHGVALPGARQDSLPSVLSSGAAWERQALLRARHCAGDAELGARVIEVAHVAAYDAGPPPVEEMHRLRLRMQHELGRERSGRWDLKLGRGGLLDIEFATQWLQMSHGKNPRVRSTDTVAALDALFAEGYLDRSAYETFRQAYSFLRRLEQRIHVLHGTGATVLEADAPGLEQLARRMDVQATARASAAAELVARYQEVTSAVRKSYESVLGLGSKASGSPSEGRRPQ